MVGDLLSAARGYRNSIHCTAASLGRVYISVTSVQ